MEAFREFHDQVHTLPVRSGCGFGTLVGLIKSLIISAVLVALIWFVLSMWLGTSDPGEMKERLGQTLKLLF
ncbi:MAG: hypothetical protein ACR2IE_17440 [Candidatus Sumerlaeaceae bacterium]